MAVAFDAAGPSASGTTGTTSPLTWSHTCAAGATHLLAAITVDSASDAGLVAAATYNGLTMTSVLRWESGGSSQSTGFLQVFALASPPAGSAYTVSVSVTGSGSFDRLSGGSASFTGSASLSTAVHTDSNGADAASGAINIPTASSSGLAVAFTGNGSGGNAFTAGTSRFIVPFTSLFPHAAAYASAATVPGTGSTVSCTWTQTSDFYAAIGLEVQPGGTGATATPAVKAVTTSIPVPSVTTGVVTVTLTSSQTWTCPANVTSVLVRCTGPGGAGAAGVAGSYSGAGGGAGEFAQATVSVTPAQGYGVTIANGVATVFPGDDIVVTAHPGGAGSGQSGGAAGTGSANTVHFDGGAGGAGAPA